MSADTAPLIRPRWLRWSSVRFWTLLVLGSAAGIYVLFGDITPALPRIGLDPLALLPLMAALVIGPPLLSGLIERTERFNVIERREDDTVIWKLSRSARVAMFTDVASNLFFATLISAYGWAAVVVQDWWRGLAAAFVIALVLTVAGVAAWRALTGNVTLAIDGEGVRGADFPHGRLSWNDVDRVTLKQRPHTQQVGLVLNGRLLWIDLAPFGITARRFLSRLADVAPRVEIDWPTGQYADL